jgi:Tfp pilus assembly protein PilE
MFCSKCGTSNDVAANFCVSCGYALPLTDQAASVARQATVNDTASDEEYYKAVIGPKNQEYYLRQFSRFDNDGKVSATWHWPAFLVTFYWMLYRKMWINAVIYFFLPYFLLILLGIVGAVSGNASGMLVGAGYLLYVAAIFILMPMYANALYYKQCKKDISAVRASSHDTQRQLGELSGKGGTSNVLIIIVLIFTFVAVIGILAAVAIPAYQDYTTKARMVQAESIGRAAADSVGNYYSQYRAIPQSLAAAGFVSSLPPSVKGISVNSQTGTVTITMDGAAVSGKSLMFVPVQDANGQLTWTCMSDDILNRYLPRDCQQSK